MSDHLDDAIQKLAGDLDEAKRGFATLVHKIEQPDWLTSVAGGVVGEIVAGPAGGVLGGLAAHELQQQLAGHLPEIQQHLASIVNACEPVVVNPIDSFVSASGLWLSLVVSPVSDLTQPMSDPDHIIDWTGDASRAYQYRKTLQQNAVAGIVSIAQSISTWIDNVLNQVLIPLVVALGNMAAQLVSDLVKVIIKIDGIAIPGIGEIAALKAMDDFVGVIADLAGDAVRTVDAVVQQLGAVHQQIDTANGLMENHSIFHHSAWPAAVNR